MFFVLDLHLYRNTLWNSRPPKLRCLETVNVLAINNCLVKSCRFPSEMGLHAPSLRVQISGSWEGPRPPSVSQRDRTGAATEALTNRNRWGVSLTLRHVLRVNISVAQLPVCRGEGPSREPHVWCPRTPLSFFTNHVSPSL